MVTKWHEWLFGAIAPTRTGRLSTERAKRASVAPENDRENGGLQMDLVVHTEGRFLERNGHETGAIGPGSRSSEVERPLHTREVAGSKPAATTMPGVAVNDGSGWRPVRLSEAMAVYIDLLPA